MKENTKIAFAGLPLSGKTTYIAALWYYIFNSHQGERYTVQILPGAENDYLNQISTKWLMCERVARTSTTQFEEVTINYRDNKYLRDITLRIPDIAGEHFANQFRSREWSTRFDSVLSNLDGLLVFVDLSDVNNKPKFIKQEGEYYRMFGEELPQTIPLTQWEPGLAPNQVKIVDFLESFSHFKQAKRPANIAIVISRWDLVDGLHSQSPSDWCRFEMPLLFQYLENNSEKFRREYFGVSAQGGNYEDAIARQGLLSLNPKDRILVVHDGKSSNDILRPIVWISNEDQD